MIGRTIGQQLLILGQVTLIKCVASVSTHKGQQREVGSKPKCWSTIEMWRNNRHLCIMNSQQEKNPRPITQTAQRPRNTGAHQEKILHNHRA